MLNEDTRDKSFSPKWVGPGSEKVPQPEIKNFYVAEKFQKIVEENNKLRERREFLINMLKDILAETEAENPNVDLPKTKELHLKIKEELEEIKKREEKLAEEILLLAEREKWEDFLLRQSMKRENFDD